MTNREHFIATLQACYFGDRKAFEEIIRTYDEKDNIIKEVRKYIEVNKVKYYQDYSGDESYYDVFLTEGEIIKLLEILDKEVNND